MPILDVEIVLRPGEVLAADLASTVADRASTALNVPVGRTWVKLRTLDRAAYAEDGDGRPPAVHPVFVAVLQAELPPPEELAAEIARLTDAIAAACDRPAQNVHVCYEPPTRGRMAFGGRLLE